LKFGGAKYILGVHDFCFCHILKQIFWEQEQGALTRMLTPVATGLNVLDLFSEAADSLLCRIFVDGVVKNVN